MQSSASFLYPFPMTECRLPRNEPHDDDDNCGGYFFTSLFPSRSRDTSRCSFAFLLGKTNVRINKRPDCSSVGVGLKYLLRRGEFRRRRIRRGRRDDAAGLAARINHSSNLREITPCNRSPGFVISARSAIKRPRCIVVSSVVWRKRRQIECFD